MTEEKDVEYLEFGDYDTEDDVEPVESEEALDYPEVEKQDDEEGQGAPGDAPRTPAQAIALARELSEGRDYVGVGYCLRAVRNYYGVPAKYLSAEAAWYATDHKVHVTSGVDVPRGVPVYWTNGRYGHIALSIGGGLCYSTDWKSPGRIDIARIDDISRQWGQRLQGYAWDINDVIVWKPDDPRTTVRISNLRQGKRNKDVLKLKAALRAKGYTGFGDSQKFGRKLTAAYRRYQLRLGYTGDAADGKPGWKSLRKLGFRILP